MKLTLFLKIREIATAVQALPRNDTGIQKHHFQTLKGLPGVGMTDAKRGRR